MKYLELIYKIGLLGVIIWIILLLRKIFSSLGQVTGFLDGLDFDQNGGFLNSIFEYKPESPDKSVKALEDALENDPDTSGLSTSAFEKLFGL